MDRKRGRETAECTTLRRVRRGSDLVLDLPSHNTYKCVDCQREMLRRLRERLSGLRRVNRILTNNIALRDAALDAATFEYSHDDSDED